MPAMKPFTELMDVILSPLKSSAIHGAANLAGNIGTTVQLCITLYIILYGWQIARGEISEPWNEFAKRGVKLGLIVAVLQSPALYKEYVIDFLAEELPDALSSAMSGNPVPDANKFDTLAAKFGILLTQIWQGTGWSAPAATARAAVVTLLVMPFVWCSLIIGFVVTMWAKAGMYFVATLGPLFIALAMFEQTRRYLHNWLDQIVTMIALQVLVAMTCGLVLEGLERAVKDAPTPENVFALAGKVIVLTVFSLAIWSSLPRLASKLGGYGASVAGAGGRAAPLETLRAPIGSFSEHGAAPAGRPELASIQPRSADGRSTAAIMPAPIFVPGHNSATPGAAGSTPPPDTPGPSSFASHTGIGRAHEIADNAATPRSDASGTMSNSALHSMPRGDGGPTAAGPFAQSSFQPDPASESITPARFASTEPHFGGSSANTVVFSGAPVIGRSDQRQLTPTAVFDDDALIAEQRTGFEGIAFETTPTRAADTVLTYPTSARPSIEDAPTIALDFPGKSGGLF
jgi:type IV secretion system protein VirB6